MRFLAIRKTREPDLLLGMLDRDADLRMVRTADRAVHYVLAENMQEFLKTHHVTEERAAWDSGARGILTAKRAREEGFCKRTAESPAELASMYRLGGRSSVDDPTLGQSVRPEWIKIEGLLDNVAVSFLSRKIEDARQQKKNLFIVEIDSPGGTEAAGDRMADILAEIKDMKTVAYVNERALGIAALVPLACRDIVLKKGASMGDVRQTVSGRNGMLHDLTATARAGLAKKAALWAEAKGHPEAVAVAMIDPDAEIVQASDSQTGANRLILRAEAEAGRDRFRIIDTRKSPGSVLTVTADEAASFGLGHVVAGGDELQRPVRRSQDNASRRGGLGRLAGDGSDQSLCELDAALHRRGDAGGRAQAARHRAAGDHLGGRVSALLRQPLLERNGRPARDHSVLDRPGLHRARDLRLSRLRRFWNERHPAHALRASFWPAIRSCGPPRITNTRSSATPCCN